MADSSNTARFNHFRHTMLKYVDMYRGSDRVASAGQRHNWPVLTTPPSRPVCDLPNVGDIRQVTHGAGLRRFVDLDVDREQFFWPKTYSELLR